MWWRRAAQDKGNKRQFAVSQIVDLVFKIEVSDGLKGDELLELRVFTPKQHLYETFTIPIAEQPVPGSAKLVDGYPRPLAVRPIKTIAETNVQSKRTSLKRIVEIPFPVAGTTIVHHSLYGKWRLEAALNKDDYRVCGPAHFFLRDR